MKNIYVITGGPGSGKTSIIESLRKKGFYCADEIARKVIKKQLDKGSNAVPWINRAEFHKLVLKDKIEKYNKISESTISFSDRGILDLTAYFRTYKMEIPDEQIKASKEYRYNKIVFIAPAWKEIYSTDNERKEPFEEALEITEQIKKAYEEEGYEVIILPKKSVEERVNFILEKIGK